MHMLRVKDLSSDEVETPRRSRNLITVVTANGEVQTNEKAQVYVRVLAHKCCVQAFLRCPLVVPPHVVVIDD